MQAVGAAEARGDAAGALELIEEHPCGADGVFFWRPSRVNRLVQLIQLEGILPGWAGSRWILDQALDVLDHRLRASHAEAQRIATELRGGAGALPGRDATDRQAKLVEHDWVYRQLCLYEHGGLRFFLGQHASADLVAGADRIGEWAEAPMRVLRILEREPTRLLYEDLASGESLVVPNTGASVFTVPGECVLGRIVPTGSGQMFDGLPLWVPEDVAEDCAGAPDAWVDALRRGVRRDREPEDALHLSTAGHNQLVTDVPEVGWQLPMLGFTGRISAPRITPEVLVDAVFDVVRSAIDGSLEHALARDADEVDPWPCIAAALVHPMVLGRVWDELSGSDSSALLALADKLFGPAGDLCRGLAEPDSGAA